MLFNSLIFLLFFGLFITLWPLLRGRNNFRWSYLVAASLVFYGWWDWRFIFLIVGSGLIDFLVGLGMVRFPRRRKWLLVLSITANIGTLATFKYLDFCLQNVNRVLTLLGFDDAVPLAGLPLPVGISFYTFQSMSYTIDVYRGQLKPVRNVMHFFAYLAMFPQLVAGPIVRAAHLLPQLKHGRAATPQERWTGLRLIVNGYAKKVIIADNLAPVVQSAFGAGDPERACALWWAVMVLFAVQIYCDFSGYSDIARGLARWMGYEFPVNFDHPYISSSFREFWTRWHISLSTWFRDYLYIPLGGGRGGALSAHRCMWITMALSGVWHGVGWTMLSWGLLHAAYLSIERLTNWPRRLAALPGGRHVATLLVFALVCVAWVFFRAIGVSQAFQIVLAMFDFTNINLAAAREIVQPEHLALVLLVAMRHLYIYFELDRGSWRAAAPARALEPLVTAGLLWASVFMRGPGQDFIYFQF